MRSRLQLKIWFIINLIEALYRFTFCLRGWMWSSKSIPTRKKVVVTNRKVFESLERGCYAHPNTFFHTHSIEGSFWSEDFGIPRKCVWASVTIVFQRREKIFVLVSSTFYRYACLYASLRSYPSAETNCEAVQLQSDFKIANMSSCSFVFFFHFISSRAIFGDKISPPRKICFWQT